MVIATKSAAKLDLCKARPEFFKASTTPQRVDLPEASYLVIEGEGEPGGEEFQADVGALYSVAYTIKFTEKARDRDFKVLTFEASWNIYGDGSELPRNEWRWQLRMMLPDYVEADDVGRAKANLMQRKPDVDARKVAFEREAQGLCVQILHVGPYESEGASIEKMLEFMRVNRLQTFGPHHEVYLNDPRRCKQESIKTILRQRVIRCAD